ncbi:uncharacterized protein LOC144280442 isoform X1 [Canis aureus]
MTSAPASGQPFAGDRPQGERVAPGPGLTREAARFPTRRVCGGEGGRRPSTRCGPSVRSLGGDWTSFEGTWQTSQDNWLGCSCSLPWAMSLQTSLAWHDLSSEPRGGLCPLEETPLVPSGTRHLLPPGCREASGSLLLDTMVQLCSAIFCLGPQLLLEMLPQATGTIGKTEAPWFADTISLS